MVPGLMMRIFFLFLALISVEILLNLVGRDGSLVSPDDAQSPLTLNTSFTSANPPATITSLSSEVLHAASTTNRSILEYTWRSTYDKKIGGLPIFLSPAELSIYPEWVIFLEWLYGIKTLTFPVDLRNLTYFLASAPLPKMLLNQLEQNTLKEKPENLLQTAFGGLMMIDKNTMTSQFTERRYFSMHVFHTQADGGAGKRKMIEAGPFWKDYPGGIPNSTKVEVTHTCCDLPDKGYWMLITPGSGIFYDVGRTIVFNTHIDACDYFFYQDVNILKLCRLLEAPECCDIHYQVEPMIVKQARDAGYNSIQFRSWAPNGPQSEVVHLQEPNQRASGCPRNHQYFTRGWRGSLPCVCKDSLDYLNCDGETKEEITVILTGDVHGSVHHVAALEEVIQTHIKINTVGRSLLLLDAGDVFIGSRFFSKRGPVGVGEIMNRLNYSAMALGNHDVEHEGDIDALVGIATFPILCVNPPTHLRHIKQSQVFNMGGQQIGVMGYTATYSDFVKDVISLLRAEAMRLRLVYNVSCVIVLGHGGVEADHQISALLSGLVDVILGGHSHMVVQQSKASHRIQAPVVHSGAEGSHVGIVKLEFAGQLLQQVTSAVEPLVWKQQNISFPASQWLQDSGWWMEDETAIMQSRKAKLVLLNGLTSGISRASECRHTWCALAEMVAQGMRSHFMCGAGRLPGMSQIVALREAGSIRGKIENGHNLTCNDISEIVPWANRLVALKATVQALRLMLQHGIESAEGNKHGGAFLHAAGLSFESNHSDSTQVGRIFFASQDQCYLKNESDIIHLYPMNWSATPEGVTELGEDQEVVVVVTEWLANGGDGFSRVLKEGHTKQISTLGEGWTEVDVLCHELLGETLPVLNVPVSLLQKGGAAMVHGLGAALGSMLAMVLTYGCLTRHVRESTMFDNSSPAASNFCCGAFQYDSYNGLTVALFGVGMSNGIYWLFFTIFMPGSIWQASNSPLTIFSVSLAAGVVNVVLTNPIWEVITRVQAGMSIDACSAALELWEGGGIVSFFKGLLPNLLLIMYPSVQSTCYYLLYSKIWARLAQSQSLQAQSEVSPTVFSKAFLMLTLGSLSSIIATLITFPIQTWRIRNQAGMSCFSKEMSRLPAEFILDLYAGILPRLAHVVVAGGIMFLVKEQLLVAVLQ